jgi:hypothetical protein
MENRFSKSAETRRNVERRLEGRLAKADARSKDVMDFQRRRQEAEEAKLLRLKTLRLAKEETERVEAADAAAKAAELAPAPRPRSKKKADPLPSA